MPMMLFPSRSTLGKRMQLSKFNQPINDQNFHCVTRNKYQLTQPIDMCCFFFLLKRALNSLLSSTRLVQVLRKLPSQGIAEKHLLRYACQPEMKAFFPVQRFFFLVQQDCKEEAAGAPAPGGDGPACVWAIQTEAAPTNVTSVFPKQQLGNYSTELKIARNKVRLKEERDLPECRWHQALCGVPCNHQVEHSTAPAFWEAVPHPKQSQSFHLICKIALGLFA